MRTDAICPICDIRVDENIARLNGFFTVLLLVVYLATNSIFPIVFLAIDFTFRGAKLKQFSLLYQLSAQVVKVLGLKPKFINAGPKVFAARIGVIFSTAILISFVFGATIVGFSFAAIFGLCAFLEAAFGFCIACEIYPHLYKLTYQSKFDRREE